MDKPKEYEIVRLKSDAMFLAKELVERYGCNVHVFEMEEYSGYEVGTEHSQEIKAANQDYHEASYGPDYPWPTAWEAELSECDCCKSKYLDLYMISSNDGLFVGLCRNCRDFFLEYGLITSNYIVGESEEKLIKGTEREKEG